MSNILEFNNRAKSGRKKIVFIAHEIYEDDTTTNKNGLHWIRKYTEDNLPSAIGMPICAELQDSDQAPLGHGYTGTELIDGEITPIFLNSVAVGSVESAEIKRVVVNGRDILALVCTGVIYTQRYPKLHKWIKENLALGVVETSVEITGKDGDSIIYEGEYDEDFRTPKVYDYSSSCILSVVPADDSAVVLEAAEAKNQNKEELFNMTEAEILNVVKTAITETNSAKADVDAKIAELNSQIEAKDAEIKELNEKAEAEANACGDKDKEIEELNAKVASLEAELQACKKNEMNSKLDAELNSFTKEEQAYAEVEINAFKAEENLNVAEVEINSIVNKINAEIGKAVKKAEAEAKVIAEQNAAKAQETNVEDILGDVIETNSANEDFDLFA